jgi:formylglycine-generating enzyme required for sulfatase activity
MSVLLLGCICIEEGISFPDAELIRIPSGSYTPFFVGKNQTPIKIKNFKVMRFPVTNKQFADFLKSHPEWKKKSASSLYTNEVYLKQFSDIGRVIDLEEENSPVTYVSWFAARAFCSDLQMRLPEMNEWEYLAKADEENPDASTYPLFSKRILEWYGKPQEGTLGKVGSTFKNIYGVYDLHGLIWEWVEDFNSLLATGESRDNLSANKNFVCAGAGLEGTNKEDYAAFMRFAFRSSLNGRSAIWNLGFRCVKS